MRFVNSSKARRSPDRSRVVTRIPEHNGVAGLVVIGWERSLAELERYLFNAERQTRELKMVTITLIGPNK
jgi:hypothetical protein